MSSCNSFPLMSYSTFIFLYSQVLYLGFNCGEAANFATPMWLSIAKEAAVRRAAMNYLPMLSHQQLLYLLTMSFISRCAFVTRAIKYLSCYMNH